MPNYRVKPGYTFGARKQYAAGAIVTLTEQEAAGFLDKLEPVAEGESAPASQANALMYSQADFEAAVQREVERRMALLQAGFEAEVQEAVERRTSLLENSKLQDFLRPTEPFDVTNATIEEVLGAIDEGKVTVADAITAEKGSTKPRTALLKELEKRK